MEAANLQTTGRHAAARAADVPTHAPARSDVTVVPGDSRLAAQLEAALIARGAWTFAVRGDGIADPAVAVLTFDVRCPPAETLLTAWQRAAVASRTRIIVAIDGMRSVGNEYESFKQARTACEAIARARGLPTATFVPVSSDVAANVGLASAEMDWYDGPTLADAVVAGAQRARDDAPAASAA